MYTRAHNLIRLLNKLPLIILESESISVSWSTLIHTCLFNLYTHTHALLLQGGRRKLMHAEATTMASSAVRKRSKGRGKGVVRLMRRWSDRADMRSRPSARRINSRSLSMHMHRASSACAVMRRQAGMRVPCCRRSRT